MTSGPENRGADQDPAAASSTHGTWFTTTCWSIVLAASQKAGPGAAAALEQLCRTSWHAHVRDWVLGVDSGAMSGAKGAWTGIHTTKGKIRVFEQTWTNPLPQVEITSLDFVSKMTKCAPFLIAITAER